MSVSTSAVPSGRRVTCACESETMLIRDAAAMPCPMNHSLSRLCCAFRAHPVSDSDKIRSAIPI